MQMPHPVWSALDSSIEGPSRDLRSYLPVALDLELWPLLGPLEGFYRGAKSFGSNGLRQIFEPLCGDKLKKHEPCQQDLRPAWVLRIWTFWLNAFGPQALCLMTRMDLTPSVSTHLDASGWW